LASGEPPEKTRRNRRRAVILAFAAVAVIIIGVILVLVLAGGDQTKDGTGRDQQGTQTTLTTGTSPGDSGANCAPNCGGAGGK
jgi:amino acid transporter